MAELRNNPGNIEVLNLVGSLVQDGKDGKVISSASKDIKKLEKKNMPSGFFYRDSQPSQWAGYKGEYAKERLEEDKKPFTEFHHKMWGIRAMFKLLQGGEYLDLRDGEIKGKKKTFDIFGRYAPKTDNNSVSDYDGRVNAMLVGETFIGADKKKYNEDQKIAQQYNIRREQFDKNNITAEDIPSFIKAMIVMENGTKTFTNDAGEQIRFVDYYLGDEENFKIAMWAAQRDYSQDETYESVKAAYEHHKKLKGYEIDNELEFAK
tara:strand:+ start:76 stop:864 length:789 start_codon:yes stop_codon:yes gene_type:complete